MRDSELDPVVLRAVLERSPDLISMSEFSGAVTYVNPAGMELVGLTSLAEHGPLFTADFFTPEGLTVASQVETSLSEVGHWRGQSELRHFVTGEPIPVAVSTFVVRRMAGEPDVIASVIRDRRQGHRRDMELQATAETATRYAAEQTALAALGRLAVDADLTGLLNAAAAAATLVGDIDTAIVARYSEDRAGHLTVDAVSGAIDIADTVPVDPSTLAGFALAHNDTIVCTDSATETRFDVGAMHSYGYRSGLAMPIVTTGGAWGVLSVYSASPRDYLDHEISFLGAVIGVVSTAVRRIETDRQLVLRSMQDALTGLPNRTAAFERIDAALGVARSESSSIALLLLDIDDFKIINDSLGHDAGDKALVRFARRLESAVRDEDTVARLGGDEFLVICEGVEGVDDAEALARNITASIAYPAPADGTPMPLSASIGVAVSDRTSTRRDLIHRADLAMYRAKDSGNGGHAVFDTDDLYDADRIRSLSVDLRAALANKELTLAYQPLVQIDTGVVVAIEALARWDHPTLGPIAPSEFVSVAERTGLAMELGSWALHTACEQAARWRTTFDVDIRVNVSALQLRDTTFPEQVSAALRATGLPPNALGLEITETVWVSDTARVMDTLTALHTMGVSILLDDLGKGHSSLSYLGQYPMFECFKIDRSYIDALPTPRASAIVTAIVSLARAFDVTVVGEGVETQEQLDALAATGCDMAQGYLLGKPMSPERATACLASTGRRR